MTVFPELCFIKQVEPLWDHRCHLNSSQERKRIEQKAKQRMIAILQKPPIEDKPKKNISQEDTPNKY